MGESERIEPRSLADGEGEVSGFLVTDSVIEAADHVERVVRGSG